jgi:hypothetical protein
MTLALLQGVQFMVRYQIGDIECSAVAEPDGQFLARVRVAGSRLQPAQAHDYIYEAPERFADATLALNHAKSHANERFPSG